MKALWKRHETYTDLGVLTVHWTWRYVDAILLAAVALLFVLRGSIPSSLGMLLAILVLVITMEEQE